MKNSKIKVGKCYSCKLNNKVFNAKIIEKNIEGFGPGWHRAEVITDTIYYDTIETKIISSNCIKVEVDSLYPPEDSDEWIKVLEVRFERDKYSTHKDSASDVAKEIKNLFAIFGAEVSLGFLGVTPVKQMIDGKYTTVDYTVALHLNDVAPLLNALKIFITEHDLDECFKGQPSLEELAQTEAYKKVYTPQKGT